MLELLGQQLLKDNSYLDSEQSSSLLDRALRQNQSIIGFGLATTEGDLVATSSNIDLKTMPNLKTNPVSRKSFTGAVESQNMVIGRTYYLEALNDWVIPIRKAIRNSSGKVTGVMTAGIQPTVLLPNLRGMGNGNQSFQHLSTLVHEDWQSSGVYYYSYISGLNKSDLEKLLIGNPVPEQTVKQHQQAMLSQAGLNFNSMKAKNETITYVTTNPEGQKKLFSLIYLPKYRMWAYTSLPFDELTSHAFRQIYYQLFFFIGAYLLLFYLFFHINAIQEKSRKQLVEQANHDFLTGLGNRQFLQQIEKQWTKRRALPFSVMFLDLDNFKTINDSYGHSYGDIILKRVARRLQSLFPKDIVCRQGGDEFIIVTRQTTSKDLQLRAESIISLIAKPFEIDNYQFSIGVSIGVSHFPQDGSDFNSLFSAADTAMYRAKQQKNNFFIFTAEVQQEMIETSRIEQAMHSALQNNEFTLVYQPQVNSQGHTIAVEALLRWKNTEFGSISPARFIPIAENNGHIVDIGRCVIDQSLKDITHLREKLDGKDLRLSINVSIRQLQEKFFVENLVESLDKYDFPAHLLTLEITESIFIEDYDYLSTIINQIRNNDIQISMDDFGTGYSSLSMLRSLPIDELKIDKSFIDDINTVKGDEVMVKNIITIAHNLGKIVVVEGVEDERQANILAGHGCDLLQGYYYSRPVPLAQLEINLNQTRSSKKA